MGTLFTLLGFLFWSEAAPLTTQEKARRRERREQSKSFGADKAHYEAHFRADKGRPSENDVE